MKLSGIYTIRNLITGAVYVGQTINLKGRREHHFGLLSKGKHPNRRLQEDYSTYGSGAFVFRREEFCLTGFLCEREAHYIKQLARRTIRRHRQRGFAETAHGLIHFFRTCDFGGGVIATEPGATNDPEWSLT